MECIDRRELLEKGISFETIKIKMWLWLVKDERGWHNGYDIKMSENGMLIGGLGFQQNFNSLQKQKIETSQEDVEYLIYSLNGYDLIIAYDLMKINLDSEQEDILCMK